MRFAARDNDVTFSLIVHNDGLVEDDEVFYISLEIPPADGDRGVVLDNDSPATVTIRDDDSECSFTAHVQQ